ncbi:MAG: hypothetical protein AAFP69_18375, partial [Planctomycetota bacterium]
MPFVCVDEEYFAKTAPILDVPTANRVKLRGCSRAGSSGRNWAAARLLLEKNGIRVPMVSAINLFDYPAK